MRRKAAISTTKLSNGTEVKYTFDVPQPYDITNWNLTVESWTPGEEIFRTEEVFRAGNYRAYNGYCKKQIQMLLWINLLHGIKYPKSERVFPEKGIIQQHFIGMETPMAHTLILEI